MPGPEHQQDKHLREKTVGQTKLRGRQTAARRACGSRESRQRDITTKKSRRARTGSESSRTKTKEKGRRPSKAR